MAQQKFDHPTLTIEKQLWKAGFDRIAGIDEVGRGSFAGPAVAAAVILPKDFEIPEDFAESKQVRPQKRKKLAEIIKRQAEAWAIAEVSVSQINKIGLGKSIQIAFRKALRDLNPPADFALVDGFYIRHLNRKNQKPIVKGDQKSASIAAASIIAKVHRDTIMKKLAKYYPEYKFSKNKGYGTRDHQAAIAKYGLRRVHRKSFDLEKFLSV